MITPRPVFNDPVQATSLAVAVLAMVASGAGLAVPGLYHDPEWLVPQARGQDVVTLLAALTMAWAMFHERSGSPRARLCWLGLLGYLAYTYVGAAFAYAFNALFLVYVALFGLSVFALAFALGRLDVEALAACFDDRTPKRSVMAFLVLIAAMLSVLWLGQIVPALLAGTMPESLERSGGSLQYVYALDLGLIVPLSALASIWLWRRRPWGFVLAGFILIKASTMGLALLAMTVFSVAEGLPAEIALFVPWVALAGGSLAMSAWYLSHCHKGKP